MRLFAALVPPPEAIAPLQAAITEQPSRLRWIPPERWHLTLAFYGEVDDPTSAQLQERLTRAARRSGPVRLQIAGAGRFGRTVLYAGVVGEAVADDIGLRRLAERAAAAGRRCGLAMESRGFRPHLTVARCRGADLRPEAALLAACPAGPVWVASELLVICSQPGAQPQYRTVGRLPLGRAAGDPG